MLRYNLVTESQRDAGLVRAVGTWGFTASIINIVIGAGIFAVPAALAACIGPYAPLAFLVCAVAVGSVAICFAEGGSRIPTSGGAYGYIDAAFGPLAGYVAGTLLWLGDVLACGGVAAALADAAVSVLPPSLARPAHAATIIAVIGGIRARQYRWRRARCAPGERSDAAEIASARDFRPCWRERRASAGKLCAGNRRTNYSRPGPRFNPRRVRRYRYGNSAGCQRRGVANRRATIPRALLTALVSVTLLYIAIQVIAQGILGHDLAHSTVPLADAMARINPSLRWLLLAGAALSMFGWIGSDVLGTPRDALRLRA